MKYQDSATVNNSRASKKLKYNFLDIETEKHFKYFWLFSMVLVWCIIIASLFCLAQARYGDVRCKCVCPRDVLKNNIVVQFVSVEECTCKNLIHLEDSRCLRCKCEYEARNTMLIKVVVIFIVIVLIILIVYMIGLTLYSFWNPENLSVRSDSLQERLVRRSRAFLRLDNTVAKWKDDVQDQRRNVYNHHSILS